MDGVPLRGAAGLDSMPDAGGDRRCHADDRRVPSEGLVGWNCSDVAAFYGLLGVLWLRVMIDVVLIAAAIALLLPRLVPAGHVGFRTVAGKSPVPFPSQEITARIRCPSLAFPVQ